MSFKNAHIIGEVKNLADYHIQKFPRGDAKFQMSVSALKEFNDCASRWIDGYESPESKSREYGSLLDCLLLTPDQFKPIFAIRPETYKDAKGVEKDWHHASHTCKEWLADQKKQGKEVISQALFDKAFAAVKKLQADSIIAPLIDSSDKQVWVAADWFDQATGITVPVKCMIDLLPRGDTSFYKNIADLKSTTDASPQKWARTVFNWRYHWQAAFNMDIIKAAEPNGDRCNFCHIVQENFPPFQVGRRIIADPFLEIGRAEYRRALANYCWCVKNKKWPDYDDNDESSQGWSITHPDPWMEGAALFGVRFKTPVEAEADSEETFDNTP